MELPQMVKKPPPVFDLRSLFSDLEWAALILTAVHMHTNKTAADELGIPIATFNRMIAKIRKRAAPFHRQVISGEIPISQN